MSISMSIGVDINMRLLFCFLSFCCSTRFLFYLHYLHLLSHGMAPLHSSDDSTYTLSYPLILHPIPSYPTPPHPIQSNPISSNPIKSQLNVCAVASCDLEDVGVISRLALLSLSARILSRAAFPTLLFSEIKVIGKGEKEEVK